MRPHLLCRHMQRASLGVARSGTGRRRGTEAACDTEEHELDGSTTMDGDAAEPDSARGMPGFVAHRCIRPGGAVVCLARRRRRDE